MPRKSLAIGPSEKVDVEPTPSPRPARVDTSSMGLAIADLGIVMLFLGLTFLLGIFPQHDTDFWWHLKTGDLIRAEGKLPITDWYTFGAGDHKWIDLHWLFQIALSVLYQAGGVNATIVAKCVVTTLAVGLLITAKRREWPLWVMALSWVPALLVLSGRMYVRPETLTLLYIAIDLAILFRIGRFPKLAWGLPIVQVFWVNSQGLFAFGPIMIGMALIDAALKRGAFAPAMKKWWRTVLAASIITCFACLVNPYGLFGALYPLTLAFTMTSPVFSDIAELQSIPSFIEHVGLDNAMLQLHLTTMALGGLSFVIPIFWRVSDRLRHPAPEHSARELKKKTKKGKSASQVEPLWRLSPFRLMLFVAFTMLSLKATRNSHQFAAVVGTITAWNFGEWAAAVSKRRAERAAARDPSAAPLIPRLAIGAVLAVLILFVGSGGFYAWTAEDRHVGWGERPLWFAHDAVKFAGSKGMPRRFLTYHNGVAGLFEFQNGREQKVYSDARLEVMGPEVYAETQSLFQAIRGQRTNWVPRVENLGPPIPGAVVDHVQSTSTPVAAAFLANSTWRCVWFDSTASVYLHQQAESKAKAVDFAARHFGRDLNCEPAGAAELTLSCRTLAMLATDLIERQTNTRMGAELATLAGGYARKAFALDPKAFKAWRTLGSCERLAIKRQSEPDPRFRQPFDPISDLTYFRATHDLAQALTLAPNDFETLMYLFDLYARRDMQEAANAIGDRLLEQPYLPERARVLRDLAGQIGRARVTVSRPAKTTWSNAGELERVVATLESEGRAETVADLLTSAYKPAERTWEQTDRIATLRLHLGRPDLARAVWLEAAKVPRPALRDARLAMTYLVQGDFEKARRMYQQAIDSEPKLFEAHYGLAILERDAGDADAALKSAKSAQEAASDKVAKAAAEQIESFVAAYAGTR